MLPGRGLAVAAVVILGLSGAAPAGASEACPGLVAGGSPLLVPAALANDEVGITFVGHATFLIESPGGVRAATDYNDYVRPDATPDVATMNKAHTTHFSHRPDPGIRHVLRGWDAAGGPARHDIEVGDMRIRNVVTNIRTWSGGTEHDGNSIFVFQTADLCIAHLGHLHHRLTKEHLDELGRIDVLMVPIDGAYTMGMPLMVDVIKQIQPKVVLPMHYWGRAQVNRFESLMQDLDADFIWPDRRTIEVVREELPEKLTVMVVGGNGGD